VEKKKRILISRTDSIGDVILTLPVAGVIRKTYPDADILFLARDYTREVVRLSNDIDEFISWDKISLLATEKEKIEAFEKLHAEIIIHVFPRSEIAKLAFKAKIPIRIGASGRLYHLLYCNSIVALSRKNSSLHESQLNMKLLKPIFKMNNIPELNDMIGYIHLKNKVQNTDIQSDLIDSKRFNIILHPKSKGSAREWPLASYTQLIRALPKEKYKLFVTGTKDEGLMIHDFLLENKEHVVDLTGRFSLAQFISFINQADGLIAASTGPLHMAGMLGKLAIGIYPPIRPMHPGRWAPLGENAHFLVSEKPCEKCRKTKNCTCMELITVGQVKSLIDTCIKKPV